VSDPLLASSSPPLTAALGDLSRRLRERFGEALLDLRLFGSYARGEAHEDSDVDVCVVLAEVDWSRQGAVIDLAADVGLAHGLSISPTVFDRTTFERWRAQGRALVIDIERDGIRL